MELKIDGLTGSSLTFEGLRTGNIRAVMENLDGEPIDMILDREQMNILRDAAQFMLNNARGTMTHEDFMPQVPMDCGSTGNGRW